MEPRKLNERRKERLLKAAREGLSKKGCARYAGISYETLRKWLNAGERGEGEAVTELWEAFQEARAEGELSLVEATKESDPRFLLATSYGYTKTERIEAAHEILEGVEDSEIEDARRKLAGMLEKQQAEVNGSDASA